MKKVNFNEDIAFYAFRYALGRQTYVVQDVVEYLITHWDLIRIYTQEAIKKEITEAIASNNAGTDIDIKEWNKILELK